MGSYKDRNRRPFIWQDEMAEVKNLFRKVAKVKSSGFTGFSVWKDEPTAETLSRNRLRRRRSQYALDLTHLNYSESPYEALNHLHNIRGMCCRIQRQDLYVERKKKDYDADLHPSLIRRPVTAFDSNGVCDGGDRASLRRRPSSAPYSFGTPLHYTAPKPTVLYDATHRCPLNRSFIKRPSSSVSSSRSGHSAQSLRGAIWDSSSALSSSVYSTPIPYSVGNQSGSQSASTSFRLNTEFAMKQDVPGGGTPQITREVEVSTSDLYSSDVQTISPELSTSVLSMDQTTPSSRLTGPTIGQETPPSRLVSKRPPRHKQQQQLDNSKEERRDDFSIVNNPKRDGSTRAGISDAVNSTTIKNDVLISNSGKSLSSTKDKDKLPDRSCGLWALKQQQHRPVTADSVSPTEDLRHGPSTSSSHPNASTPTSPSCPGQAKVRVRCSSPARNKNTGKRDDMPIVQMCADQSDESCSATEYSSRTEPEIQSTSGHAHSCDAYSEHQASSGICEAHNTASTAAGEDSHVLIKHSTDPYADFKTSMMHMIIEEGLTDKQWELEELFQYYMDLNPVVHHDILRRVISDIKKDLAAGRAFL